jgi:alpha-ketoglutarate-dependent 2,4-dichlorophenoxyacetate dioxygenase
MGVEVWPVTDRFAAEIGDVDLSCPLSDADWRTIEDAFHTYGVLVFPDQDITQDQHVAFAKRFGPIDPSMQANMDVSKLRVPLELADVSNLTASGQVMAADNRLREFQHGNQLWHTDSSFKRVPAKASLLLMRAIPPVGGQTEFADMRAAWDTLPDDLKAEVEGRVAYHAIAYSRARQGFAMSEAENAAMPPVPQAMVRHHACSGRTSLYIASHIGRIEGMDDDAALALVDALMAHATQPRFIHAHRWRVNDLVLWDNRCTMHRGRAFDDLRWPRDGQRATVQDAAPTCEQEGLAVAAE